jgi:CheY-like chemotaxis protein
MKLPNILIVEDDQWLAEQYARVLRQSNYGVTVAQHALMAIQAVDVVMPDAIVLDMLLTGSTALALMHELQSYVDTGSIPIILCTNLASELSLDDLKPYGVKLILDKAIMLPEDLAAGVRSVLL